MMIRTITFLTSFCVVGLLVMLSPTEATALNYLSVEFEDSFDNEHGGSGAINYTGFAKWTVTSGSVDLLGNGFNAFPMNIPGHGLYIDMDGSTNQAGTMVSHSISLDPGDYVLSFDLTGSHRDVDAMPFESVTARVISGAETLVDNLYSLKPLEPAEFTFATFTESFTISEPSTVQLVFFGSGKDNKGMILDNVVLGVVPEPSTFILTAIGLAWLIALKSSRGQRNV